MKISGLELRYVKLFCKAITEGVIEEGLCISREAGVPEGQMAALKFITDNPESTLSHVALALNVSPPAATRLVDGLVKKGMVFRVQSETDRRALVLSSSERGRKLIRGVEEAQMEGFNKMVSQMTDEERSRLLNGIKAFIEGISKVSGISLNELCLHCGEAHDPECILAPWYKREDG